MIEDDEIFGNRMPGSVIRKAVRNQKKYISKYGDESGKTYHLVAVDNPVLTPAMGVKVLKLSDEPLGKLPPKPLVIGNIRMGFGHYRISMAIASAARKSFPLRTSFTPRHLGFHRSPSCSTGLYGSL